MGACCAAANIKSDAHELKGILTTSDVNIPGAAFEIGAALCVLDDAGGKAALLLDKVGPVLAKVLQQIEGLADPAAGGKSELPQRRKLVERMRKIQGNLSPKCDQVGRCLDGATPGAAQWDQMKGLNNPWLQAQLRASRGSYCNRLTKLKALMEFGAAVHQFLQGGKFPELPQLLGTHGIIEKQHVQDSLALFERLNIASTAFAGNRDRWERVPLCLQPFFDAPRQPQEGERYLEERMAKVYTQARDVDHLDGFGDMIDWKKLEVLALAGNLAQVGLTEAKYNAFMTDYIKEWPSVERARATLRRRKKNADLVDMSLAKAPVVAAAKAEESRAPMERNSSDLAGNVAALKAAVRIQAIARGRADRLRVTASDANVMRSVRANVPKRYRAPMAAEQPARPGLLSDAAAHNLRIDPALEPFKAAGLIDALAAHDFPHGTGMNRWDVRPGKYAQSVVGAGGAVAGAQSAGTAYTLFGLQLLTGANHLDVATVSAAKQKQEYVYAVGLMVASFMNFGAYHSFLETFPIVEAMAADVPFFEGSVGPIFNGKAPATYSRMVSKISEYTAAGSKAGEFLSAYQTASKQPSLVPRSLGGADNLHAAILLSDVASAQ